MSEPTEDEKTETQRAITLFKCGGKCSEGEHDWTGPPYEREHCGGGFESGATCAKCGMEFGHFALWELP